MSLNGLLEELRKDYLETFPKKIQLIETLLREQDLSAIDTEFHKMKGTGQTYGVPDATLLGEAVESVCQNSFEKCKPVIELALNLMRQIHQAHVDGSIFVIALNSDFKHLMQRVQSLTSD